MFLIIIFVNLGFVKKDPKLSDKLIMAPPPQRPPDSVFDQEDKAKVCVWLCNRTSVKMT